MRRRRRTAWGHSPIPLDVLVAASRASSLEEAVRLVGCCRPKLRASLRAAGLPLPDGRWKKRVVISEEEKRAIVADYAVMGFPALKRKYRHGHATLKLVLDLAGVFPRRPRR